MASLVNLDALLPREDLAERDDVPNFSAIHTIGITQLESGFFLNALRKPDFQRETSDWTSAKVFDLIRSFVDGELVPPVILWQAGGRVFVIDGGHRLSALMAWVHNDYGDGDKSRLFFQNQIPPEQIKVAERTRKMVHAEIGAYTEYLAASKNVGTPDKKILARLGRLATVAVPLHWVPTVSFKQAERSFFKINQAATPIDKTELRILESRETPSAIAARAIMRGGTGHKYWAEFDKDIGDKIEATAKKIRAALYEPPLQTPIKTLDLPVAGGGYGALPFIFDFVNLANGVRVADSSGKGEKKGEPEKDSDGSKTVEYLETVERRLARITGTDARSLGVHPAVYFYTLGGQFQPTAFLATTDFLEELDRENKLVQFSKIRSAFEEFLVTHKMFISQIVHKQGSGGRSRTPIKAFYRYVADSLLSGEDGAKTLTSLIQMPAFDFLKPGYVEVAGADKKDFSRGVKTATFLKEALDAALTCAICHARLHRNSIHTDHKERRRDGGSATVENAQLSHPYCNSTVKN